ncbi:MAG: ABC transporter ATP-binding protein [Kiritimatiellia bacterium]|nr:ABC transporter ATP-binding protein [Kiritimatiellia bacterium]
MNRALRFEQVTRKFGDADHPVPVLEGIDYELPNGAFHALMGRSGSGKSTFLNLAAGLLPPTSGRIWVGDQEITALDDDARTILRRRHIGVVFQDFNLIPTLTLLDNIRLPFILDRKDPPQEKIETLLNHFGLQPLRARLPHETSGGERQRTAIVRALALSPDLLLGDEPTGSLDLHAGEGLCTLLREANRTFGVSVLLVTHDPMVAAQADQVHFLVRGRLADTIQPDRNPETIAARFLETIAP